MKLCNTTHWLTLVKSGVNISTGIGHTNTHTLMMIIIITIVSIFVSVVHYFYACLGEMKFNVVDSHDAFASVDVCLFF